MNDLHSQVENMLKSYPEMVQELRLLEFELESMDTPLDSRLIESHVFSHPSGERVAGSFHSDRTADIVIEHLDHQRSAKYLGLKNLVFNMRYQMRRIDHYLTLLPKEEESVIRWFYMDGLKWPEITARATASQSTLQRRKKKAIDKLVHFFSVVEGYYANDDDIRMRASFISYVHEEQYVQCLNRAGMHRTPGVDAMLYIISGCNELWNAGADVFFDFESGEVIPQDSITESFSAGGARLLRIAYCCAQGLKLNQGHLLTVVGSYFVGLEHIHLELAIEGMRLALFPNPVHKN